MTSALPFSQTLSSRPATPDRRAEVLADPGFGRHFTDHMVRVRWNQRRGWHDAELMPYRPIELDPASAVLHYAQIVFEGLKAYRWQDGTIAAFRPEANAARFQSSARRLAMPELPEELFLASLRELVSVDRDWVPAAGEDSLYLRPYMIPSDVGLGVHPASEYQYLLIACPVRSYFASGAKPVTVWWSTDYTRAAPGGTGAAKCAGNYAASLAGQAEASEHGCDQVVWLDAVEHRWVEEMGGMNLCFVFGSGANATLVTPQLTGTLLPGVTRDSLLRLGGDLGYQVQERRVSTEEWQKKAETGEITEVFACGTAAVITPVGRVKHTDGEFAIGDGGTGPITLRLRDALTSIQRGTAPDRHGWVAKLV